ncbi:hypothetical protein [Streptomyces griseorubiginosus]|uniref:hypothetical protein n=1 Tax=Streptomyces griseorubiginosus TaxID=67304 RepID=UPI002E823598|nr:hypothetical protein [Streptomyces griseorubiginosus]WUB46801.1 hypothetical protein OHN19_27110 [Streptomyces griseorubiginosus]WUB55323.1 hypothetical protein OG942_27115 [Streptomyces griseorubiginosus]
MPYVLGYGAEDLVGGFSHRYDTPRLVGRLNADWYDLAVSSGLFDHRREFLVQLPQGVRSHRAALRHQHSGSDTAPAVWTRVRLLKHWDIMGRAAGSAFLGVHAGHPGFAMMALDSSVYIRASTGEMGVDVLAVRRPDHCANVLRRLEWIAGNDSPYVNREFRERIGVWLAGRAG